MSGCTDQLGLQGGGDRSWKSRGLSVEGLRASWGGGPWMPWAAPSDSPPYKQGPRGHVQQRTSERPPVAGPAGDPQPANPKWPSSQQQEADHPPRRRGGCRYSKPLSTHFSSNELVPKKGKTAARQEAGSAVQALTCSRSLGRGADQPLTRTHLVFHRHPRVPCFQFPGLERLAWLYGREFAGTRAGVLLLLCSWAFRQLFHQWPRGTSEVGVRAPE
ncbi:uncharacterized protein LOC123591502 [Leopardus geoffroyi]|uniref:uncharacterized protein LOC123591502 n=1 Tax=Leopardus geoffroyi TaxID=46844 RepID=UPI001E26188C|nr:uncharacterized protein LOC123591502 [Leopardus geoffroyi]